MVAHFFNIMQLIRSSLRDEKRRYFRTGKFFIKVYNSHKIADNEYRVIRNVRKDVPLTFGVPKILKLVSEADRTIVIMEREEGTNLEILIFRFLSGQSDIIDIFYRLGQAIHDFHRINVDIEQGIGIPNSGKEVLYNIMRITKKLNHNKILNDQTVAKIFNATRNANIDDKLTQAVNLHGEAYFTHIIVSKEKFIFLDLERACKGALYYDLATFSTSIYASLLIPRWHFPKLLKLRNAFVRGYFGNGDQFGPIRFAELCESMKIAELYRILKEVDKICHSLVSETPLRTRFLHYAKIRRFLWLINVLSEDTPIQCETRVRPT